MANLLRCAAGLALALLAWPSAGRSQTADTRIAVVHMQELVEGSADFRRASEQWSLELSERTSQVQSLQEQIREARNRLTALPEGDPSRAELVREIEGLQVQVDRRTADVQTELNALRQELLAPVVEKMTALARSYAEDNGIDVLIDTSNQSLGLTLAIQDIEITDDLLRILDEAESGEASPDGAEPDEADPPGAPPPAPANP